MVIFFSINSSTEYLLFNEQEKVVDGWIDWFIDFNGMKTHKGLITCRG